MTFTPGQTIGPYRIIQQLGQGGMATVFKAYHAALDRDVAIKVLHPAFKNDPNFFARFQREARIVANLEHPHIVPVYDFNDHQGEPYLVMRFVQGNTLKPHLKNIPLPHAEVLRLMQPICQALAYAHKQGILHRDIKPSNIMLTDDGNVFLTDFGLARMAQAGESTLSRDTMIGTPQYISPEQAQGEKNIDGRADIYSLGVILFEMLTGSVPYSGDTPFAIIHDHIYKPLPLPSTINPNIDSTAEKVILRALSKNPDDRFKTVQDFLEAIQKALISAQDTPLQNVATQDTVVEKQPPKKSNRNRWIGIGIAILLILITCFCCLIFLIARERNLQSNQATTAQTTTPSTNQPNRDEESTIQAEKLHQEGQILAQQGDREGAIAKFAAAVEADPQYTQVYYSGAILFLEADNPQDALAAVETGIHNNPDDTDLQQFFVYVQIQVGHLDEARQTVEQAIIQNSDNALPYTALAKINIAEQNFGRARENLNKALEIDNTLLEAKLTEVELLWLQDKQQDARRLLQVVLQDGVEERNLDPIARYELRRIRKLVAR